MHIGFIGAGMMGHGICANLLAAGHDLTVVAHRNRKPIDDLVARGASEAPDVATLVPAVDVLMICVNSADTVEALLRGPGAALRKGSAVVDVTTSLPETSRGLAEWLAGRGVDFMDAPVVGGPPQAEAGTLGSLVGAEDGVFAHLEPLLRCYSADVAHFGPPGAGNAAKLLNNFLTVGLRALILQAFQSARRHGIDWGDLYRLASQGAASSRTLDTMVRGALEGDYRGNTFSLSNCLKDMSYAGVMLADDPDGERMQQAMAELFQRYVDAGLGDRFASETLDPEIMSTSGRAD